MKIAVEIQDSRIIFEYEIGSSKHSSSSIINPEIVCYFSDMLRQLSNVTLRENKEFERELNAQIWIDNNKEKAKTLINDKEKTKTQEKG